MLSPGTGSACPMRLACSIATALGISVDAGTSVGNATQVRVSYDLTGNGSFDRVETFRYFATDPIPGLPPLTGGMVGMISYDAVRRWEKVPATTPWPIRALTMRPPPWRRPGSCGAR